MIIASDLRVSWLDVKLGFRMLGRYPGLTLIGGLAMAFAIWVGAGTFELATQVIRPTLPFEDGDRIVGLRVWDAQRNEQERRIAYDFSAWRRDLGSVEDLGAFRIARRNLITANGLAEPIAVAEISASAFRVTGVRPMLGRALEQDDEHPAAPAVAVIGYDLWQTRFAGAADVVGQTVRIGSTQSTVVGVMPEGFAFPVANSFWVPLRLAFSGLAPLEGPPIQLFGRLARGASLRDAEAELTTLGRRAAADHRPTHEHLRPQVKAYAQSLYDLSSLESAGVMSMNLPVILLLLLLSANVALLMFARAATRESEIVVRSALGASRGRIVMQLFAEALVLGGVAAVIGLGAASAGIRWAIRIVEGEFLNGEKLPFWIHADLSPTTVLYAALLTVLAAVIAGAMPGLKVTRGVGERLKAVTAGGGGLRFGGVWTAIIVVQVALTMAFPIVVLDVRRSALDIRAVRLGFPDREYLTARIEMERDPEAGAPADTSQAAFVARFRATYRVLEQRLLADPAVEGVTFADRLPRMYHPHRLIDVDEGGAVPLDPQWPAYRVSAASVGPTFFEVLRAPILAGRGFSASEHEAGLADPGGPGSRGGVAIVNESFVRLVLGGRNPIGRRIRYVKFEEGAEEITPRREAAPWYQVVGVVRDMGMSTDRDPKRAGIYHPVPTGALHPAQLAVHVRGDAIAFAPRLRALATETDPTLRLASVEPMNRLNDAELDFYDFWFRLLLAVTAVALTLSLAGIYAVMSFTVARRTREIGVRVALGASPRRVIGAVFRRPLIQVALGVLAGAALLSTFAYMGALPGLWLKRAAIVIAYSMGMMAVCSLACVVPTWRALRVQPTEALRADG